MRTTTYEKDLHNQIFKEYKDNGIFDKEVNIHTRELVEKLYKISIQTQLKIEEYLDNKNDLTPLDIPLLSPLIHPHAKHYYNVYGVNTDLKIRKKLQVPDWANEDTKSRLQDKTLSMCKYE